MKVVTWPADLGGCGVYRLIEPADVLADQGAEVVVEFGAGFGPRVHWDRPWDGPHPPLDARVLGCDPIDADVVVIQRPFRRQWAEVIPHMQARGTAVVVDMDDALHPTTIPRDNAAWAQIDGSDPDHNWQWCVEAMFRADLVTVSTAALARQFPGALVLPNLVPRSYLDLTATPHDPVRLGWLGWVGTHPGDLEVTRGAVQRVLDATGCQFHHVGPPGGVRERLQLRDNPVEHGPAAFAKLLRYLARFDVALVPLAPGPFNQAKSYLKGVEASALGLPFVASPTAEYQLLRRYGAGLVAATPAEWVRHLTDLVRSSDYRAEQGGRNREVAERLTYDRHAEQWWAAWTTARVNFQRRRVAA